MTPLVSLTKYGSLILAAPLASQVGIRAITRNAPANSIPAFSRCCRP